jgi:hypothetical protein
MFIRWLQKLMGWPVSLGFVNDASPFPLPGRYRASARYGAPAEFVGRGTAPQAGAPRAGGLTDVTARLRPGRLLFGRQGRALLEVWVLQNVGGTEIDGPLYVVLDDPAGRVRLRNAAGFARNHVRPGAPYVRLDGDRIWPGRAVAVDLLFDARKDAPVQFTFAVLAGSGVV